MNFTGERYQPEIGGFIQAEHVHRYRLACLLGSGKRVLDVACGEGYGSDLLVRVARSVTGVDISAEAVEHAKRAYPHPNLTFLQGDCAALPCDDAIFDLVVSFETIEHHHRHDEMLREVRRVLRPDGVLLMSSPNRPEYDRTLSEPNPFHVRELDLAEFETLLRAHFSHVECYAQRVITGSVIASLSGGGGAFHHYDGETESHQIPHPVYFVAVASDGPLPALGVSVFGAQGGVHLNQASSSAEMRLYISEMSAGVAMPYGEERGAACLYPVSGQRQALRLTLPAELRPLARIRLDPANQPAAMVLHSLALTTPEGTELWRWDGRRELFRNVLGLVLRKTVFGLLAACFNEDPQFDLAIPEEVLRQLVPGSSLAVEMTPRPLLDVLPDLLSDTSQPGSLPVSPTSTALTPPGFAREMVEVAKLMKTQIERRNATIASQRAQIDALQGQQRELEARLLRSEAQLDVLKEFVLSAFGKTNERI